MTQKLTLADIDKLIAEARAKHHIEPVVVEGRLCYLMSAPTADIQRYRRTLRLYAFVRRWRRKFPIMRA